MALGRSIKLPAPTTSSSPPTLPRFVLASWAAEAQAAKAKAILDRVAVAVAVAVLRGLS